MRQRCVILARTIMQCFLQAWLQALLQFGGRPTHGLRRGFTMTTPQATTIPRSWVATEDQQILAIWALSERETTKRNAMRAVFALALALSIVVCASAGAASVRRVKPGRLRTQHLIVPPEQRAAPAGRFAVPGWSDDATRRWLDHASSPWTQA